MALGITDIKVLRGDGVAAETGWQKSLVDLNEAAGGEWLYLTYRRDAARQSAAGWITEIDTVTGDHPAPEGWTKDPTDLNEGTGHTRIYFVYRRGGKGAPIIGLEIVPHDSPVPSGYEVRSTNLNQDAGGTWLHLAVLRDQPKTLTIERIACVTPSTGVGDLAHSRVAMRVNGERVWPYTAHGEYEMHRGDVVEVGFVLPFDRRLEIAVTAEGSLRSGSIEPGTATSGPLVFDAEDGGDVYTVDVTVGTALVPKTPTAVTPTAAVG